ncbi:MAG: hypothetical protein EZS28_034655, partial [Streblomastix strix]
EKKPVIPAKAGIQEFDAPALKTTLSRREKRKKLLSLHPGEIKSAQFLHKQASKQASKQARLPDDPCLARARGTSRKYRTPRVALTGYSRAYYAPPFSGRNPLGPVFRPLSPDYFFRFSPSRFDPAIRPRFSARARRESNGAGTPLRLFSRPCPLSFLRSNP